MNLGVTQITKMTYQTVKEQHHLPVYLFHLKHFNTLTVTKVLIFNDQHHLNHITVIPDLL